MELNKCKWRKLRDGGYCNKLCKKEYCPVHDHLISKRGSTGVLVCIGCSKGIKGKTQLCGNCGGHNYKELARYYRRKYNITLTEQDYISGNYKVIFKENSKKSLENQLDNKQT